MAAEGKAALEAHQASGLTTVCQAWAIRRTDGVVLGFTDHDGDLSFDGVVFRAATGMSALALQHSTGLSVDNTEAVGALSADTVTEADIDAGRYDGAEVEIWRVNWADTAARQLIFRGHLGELRRSGGQFTAELRGLTEALNRPLGAVFQKPCPAVLGDGQCQFDLTRAGYRAELAVESVEAGQIFDWPEVAGFDLGWFAGGRIDVLSGAAAGLWGSIRRDDLVDGARRLTLWTPFKADVVAGDLVRLSAGCDKSVQTCRLKFDNLLNYQGFPDIPGEDWMMAYPRSSGANTGGSRR